MNGWMDGWMDGWIEIYRENIYYLIASRIPPGRDCWDASWLLCRSALERPKSSQGCPKWLLNYPWEAPKWLPRESKSALERSTYIKNQKNLQKIDPGRAGSTKEEKKVGILKVPHPILMILE